MEPTVTTQALQVMYWFSWGWLLPPDGCVLPGTSRADNKVDCTFLYLYIFNCNTTGCLDWRHW